MRSMLVVVLLLVVAGCSDGDSVPPTIEGNERAVDSVSIELFEERVVAGYPGCVTCHSMDDGVILVGPSLSGLAERAPTRVPGLTAAEYIRQSIVAPDAFVVTGFDPGQMVGDWGQVLSAAQIDSLVELLLSR